MVNYVIRYGKILAVGIVAEGDKIVVLLEKDMTMTNDINADWVEEIIKLFGDRPELF